MTGALACALLLAVLVLVETCPGRRPSGTRMRWKAFRLSGGRPRRPRRPPDVAEVMGEVAARLRSGSPVHSAWQTVLERAGLSDGTPIRDRVDLDAAFERWSLRFAGRRGGREEVEAQLLALRLATHLAERLGAPLAEVLDRCSAGVIAAGDAEAARRVALAGPVSTARLLTTLPLVGLLLGVALGVDPASAVLDGSLGSAAAVGGLALLTVGHRWTSRLIAAAREAGTRAR